MTLSGNLGFVPLDEVLRLLTRAGNTGVVQITNGAVDGRVFVTGQGIGLATTFEDDYLQRHLVNSGYLRPDAGERFDFSDDLIDVIREMTVESVYRMQLEPGDFQVAKDVTSPYAAPTPFELEHILEDARRRAEQWDKVKTRIPDLDVQMKINRDLQRESVEIDRESWRVISEIGSGASVSELSRRLGTTDYAVASVAASLLVEDLLTSKGGFVPPVDSEPSQEPHDFEDAAAEPVEPVSEPSFEQTEPVVEAPVAEEPVAEESHDVVAASDEAKTEDEPAFDPNQSWWDEPEDDEAPAASEESGETDPAAAEGEGDGEDTDAFLEKVFSEVGSENSEEDGHGLMRRRRMGSILRELGED